MKAMQVTVQSPGLIEGEFRFRRLFEGNPAAVLLLDSNGRIVEANQATHTLFGYEPIELRGQALSALMPDWDQPAVLADVPEFRELEDATLRDANGRRREVTVTLLPAAADANDVACGYFLLVRDVTVQRRLQRQMVVQAEILARTQDAVVVVDEAGKVVCWNAGAVRLYGASAQAMALQRFDSLFEAPERSRLQQALVDASFEASEVAILQVRRTGPPGRDAVLLLTVSHLPGVEIGRELWMIQGQDIGDKHQEQEARRALAAVDRQTEQCQRLVRSAAKMGQTLGRKAMLQRLAEVARVRLGAHQSAIWLHEGPDRQLAVRAVSMSAKYPKRRGTGSIGGQALACPAWGLRDQGATAQLRASQGQKRLASSQYQTSTPEREWLAAPMYGPDGHVIGLLQVCDRDEGAFDDQDRTEIEQVGQIVATALHALRADDAAPRLPGAHR